MESSVKSSMKKECPVCKAIPRSEPVVFGLDAVVYDFKGTGPVPKLEVVACENCGVLRTFDKTIEEDIEPTV